MIRVTVELLPFGQEAHAQHKGTAIISNNGSGAVDVGNYNIGLSKWGRPKQTWRKAYIYNFKRKKQGSWDLLLYGLLAALKGRVDPDVEFKLIEDPKVKQDWDEFWAEIVAPDGMVDMEQVAKELCDYHEMMQEVAKVYTHVTGGRISKINTVAEAVIAEADAAYERLWNEDELEETTDEQP